ncbi:MAG: hypothetical protein HUJ25_04960 [Crocinitomicaceae bacterium]|nr:hypothetical protein [Crocinitomicaceae bacterium]
MKKYLIAFTFVAGIALILSSFNSTESTTTIDGDSKKVSNSEVWEFMHDKVFNKLNTLVTYDKERMFSRCPSGFSQHMDEEVSDNQFVFGTITFAQGCSRDEFCLYKLDWTKKETYLKKTEKEEYVALDTFVKNEKKKVAKI